MPPAIFIVSCTLFTGLLVWGEYKNTFRWRWFAKPLASASFILTAIAFGADQTVYGVWVLAALVFCAVGDVLLISNGNRTFLAGMGAFAIGHAAYIGAFLSVETGIGSLYVIALVGTTILALLTLRWLWPYLGAFRWPVIGYAAIIACMVSTSVIAAPPSGAAPYYLIILGAFGFAISDLSVAKEQFVKPGFRNKAWGLPLYYGAQLMLASSV
ncbi:lysoplasmalogenase [Hyphococcus flavus]|uniref:Lysoplasmalogenase n=1 Tax=Hyphococcus flavus TaxID=1866326 RepID=A0AAF0CIU0_9PROT|nr:lysoplasmalogenase [Hyphococcus flavus]WDI33207.1 lysoplasmalogenase [Hyphococcus flavus]